MSQGKNSFEKTSYRPRNFGNQINLVWFPLLQGHIFTAGVGNTKKRQCEEFPSIQRLEWAHWHTCLQETILYAEDYKEKQAKEKAIIQSVRLLKKSPVSDIYYRWS